MPEEALRLIDNIERVSGLGTLFFRLAEFLIVNNCFSFLF
jgi:hypothetical protein